MKHYFTFLFLICILINSYAQKIFWSDVTPADKDRATEVAKQFFLSLQNRDLDSLQQFLMPDELNYGGEIWMPVDDWIEMVDKLSINKKYEDVVYYGYLFDDFLENSTENDIVKKMYKVFDNHSIIIHAISEQMGAREDVLLVMRMDKDANWKVYALDFIGIPVNHDISMDFDISGFRKEIVNEAGISMYLPNEYTGPEADPNQINFSLKGETERDAVFQIMIDENKAKIYYYTYKFVEHMNMQYNLSNLVVSYLPVGIKFEYEVIDPYGTKNKGITVGLSSKNKNIVIQYYSFLDIFERNKKEVNYSIDSIELLKED